MTAAELSALLHGLAPAVRDFVLSTQKALSDRLTAVETQDLPAGKDGKDGEPGIKGENGKDGRDGLGFDDFDVVYDEFGRASVRLMRGDQIKMWPLHNPTNTGAFKEGQPYQRGDGAQYGGHQWTAKEDTDGSVKPDEHTSDGKRVWVMSVRRGREGKAGPAGSNGLNGKDGRDGKDWGRG